MDIFLQIVSNMCFGMLKYIVQGFSYLSEVGTRGLLNLGKKHLDHRNWESLMQSKGIGLPF